MTDIDRFYFDKKELLKGCLLALKNIIQNYNQSLLQKW